MLTSGFVWRINFSRNVYVYVEVLSPSGGDCPEPEHRGVAKVGKKPCGDVLLWQQLRVYGHAKRLVGKYFLAEMFICMWRCCD